MKMIFTLIALLTFIVSFTARPVNHNSKTVYNELAQQVEKQLEAFAFLSSDPLSRIYDAVITENGEVQLHSGKGKPVLFNLYELAKTYDAVFGIELIKNAIHFRLPEQKQFALGFKDEAMAKQVYDALVSLVLAGKDRYSPELLLDINETVDSINNMLDRLSTYGAKVRVNITGTVIITNSNMQFFSFNLADLGSSEYSEGFEVNGIEMIPCTYRKVAPNNWINFNSTKRTMAYIKFYDIDDEELGKLHQLFIHLRTSMMNIMNV